MELEEVFNLELNLDYTKIDHVGTFFNLNEVVMGEMEINLILILTVLNIVNLTQGQKSDSVSRQMDIVVEIFSVFIAVVVINN